MHALGGNLTSDNLAEQARHAAEYSVRAESSA
jgi:hypothetical protein